MKTTLRRLLCTMLCAALLLGALPCAAAETPQERLRSFLLANAGEPAPGEGFSDWLAFSLARSGAKVPEGWFAAYLTRAEQLLRENGGTVPGTVTHSLRLMLTLKALGQPLEDFGGYDLHRLLLDTGRLSQVTMMGPIYGLILLRNDGGNEKAEGVYLRHLLDHQLKSGGWALWGETPDPDVTAMTLQALAACERTDEVSAAIDRGLACLSGMQRRDGGFYAWGSASSESISQAIIALCQLGIPMDDSRFVKEGSTLLTALLRFQQPDGSFCHIVGDGGDAMACHQALEALEALRRLEEGLPGLLTLTDPLKVDRSFRGLPGKHADIRVPKAGGKVSFSDLSGCPQREAILALAERGVLNGVGGGRFSPDGRLDRAQFCAMAVRALGLTKTGDSRFSDVPSGAWYAKPVAAAARYKLVSGVGNGKFAPDRTITRQEAAVLLTRVADLLGLDTALSDRAVRSQLTLFDDGRRCADWARPALAFCVQRGLLGENEMTLRPLDPITRAETAQLVYSLLDLALLLNER